MRVQTSYISHILSLTVLLLITIKSIPFFRVDRLKARNHLISKHFLEAIMNEYNSRYLSEPKDKHYKSAIFSGLRHSTVSKFASSMASLTFS